MRIGIDARFFGSVGKGLGRYAEKLIENLEAIDQDNQYFIFLRKENFDEYQPKNQNFQKVLADFQWYGWGEQIKFPKLLKKYKLDLMHFLHFNVPILYFGKFVITVHDLTLLHFPTIRSSKLSPIKYWCKFMAYRMVIRSAMNRSNRIMTVSRFTKKDILENYKKIPQEKVIVAHESCDDYCIFNPKKEEEILPRYGIIKPYIVFVGNAYPHKNLEGLCLAFREVLKEKNDLKLVLVGREDYFYERLKNFVQKEKIDNVIFAGYVPDFDLDIVYRSAESFVFPSLYEGFGLPPLEAMARRVPVISSDSACMPEILGDSAKYFDAKNFQDMSETILSVLDDKALREELVEKGQKQIAKYSWRKMSEKTLEVYRKILNKNK